LSRKKRTPLEEEILNLWEEMTFPPGEGRQLPSPKSEALKRPKLDHLLALAWDGKNWRISASTAAIVALSRFYNAWALAEYDRAELECQRILNHPEFENLDRMEKLDVQLKLQMARMEQGEWEQAPTIISGLIFSGLTYPRTATHMLFGSVLYEPVRPPLAQRPLTDAIRHLLLTIAKARRAPKKIMAKCEEATTLEDSHAIIEALRNY
jgi:hypothetical protein